MNKTPIVSEKAISACLYSFWLLCASACNGQVVHPLTTTNGLVISHFFFFNPKTKNFVRSEVDMPSTRVWYKDSAVIQERSLINDHSEEGGPSKRWISLIGYTYIDLRKGWFYHYKTLTDTATLVDKWLQEDTATFHKNGGAWTFYSENKGLMEPAEEPTPIPDTVRNGVLYKRLRFPRAKPDGYPTPWVIAYFRCDKKGTLFQSNKALSRKMGCPMTRYEVWPEGENPFIIAEDTEFVREYLTAEEMKVFAAWEKNAKENPVK